MPGALHSRRLVRVGAAMSLIATMAVGTAIAATAEPSPKPVYPSKSQVDKAKAAVTSTAGRISQLDADYASASARLAQVQDQAATANEAYNGARYELDQRTAEATAAKKRAADAQRRADAASLVVRQYAATVYQEGGSLGSLEAYLSATGPQDLMDRAAALEAVGDARARTLEQASATSVVADTMRRQAALAEQQQAAAAKAAQTARDTAKAKAEQAQAAATQIKAQQSHLVTQLATLRKTSVDLEKQRQDGLAAAAAARAAAAEAARQARLAAARAKAARNAAAKRAAQAAAQRAAAEAARQRAAAEQAARDAANNKPTNPPSDPGPSNPPPPRGGASAVIAYAQAQLGKPYGWGAEGPGSFDCSGLTMMAWRQAGVYLSHYTGAQWSETNRVAISDLRVGDLVFFGSSGPSSHHVGLYVGGGQMIEAPHTGAVVRYASIYRSDLLPYGGRP